MREKRERERERESECVQERRERECAILYSYVKRVVLGSSPPLSSPSRDQVRNLLSPSPSSSPKGAELDSSPSP